MLSRMWFQLVMVKDTHSCVSFLGWWPRKVILLFEMFRGLWGSHNTEVVLGPERWLIGLEYMLGMGEPRVRFLVPHDSPLSP